jgi:hypothetical protein
MVIFYMDVALSDQIVELLHREIFALQVLLYPVLGIDNTEFQLFVRVEALLEDSKTQIVDIIFRSE